MTANSKTTKSTSKAGAARRLTGIAMLSAVAFALQFLEFPIPIMPAFIKLDFSDLPELLAAFAYGPLAGVAVAGIKNLIHLPLSSSMYVGELSNFLLGAVLSVAAGAIYKKHKTKRGALAAAVLSAVIMGLISVPVNYWIIYPLYYNVLGFPQAAVLDMYRAILPATKSILQALFIFNLPFTVAKGLLCAALAMTFLTEPKPARTGVSPETASGQTDPDRLRETSSKALIVSSTLEALHNLAPLIFY